jgi:hypothetical protein
MFACEHLKGDVRLALSAGGRLDCVSALRERGIWTGADDRIHLRMPASGHLHDVQSAERLCIHWSGSASGPDPLRVSTTAALRQAMGCLPPDDMIAALESAAFKKAISRPAFEALRDGCPARLRTALAQARIGPQSGYETHSRLRLQRAGYTVEPQVFVPGVGHIDNLVDDIVDLETDGRAFHADTFYEDRERDLAAQWMGLRVIRVPATMVDTQWDYIEETVARMVREGRLAHRSA